MSRAAIDLFMSIQSDTVRSNTTIVSAEELGHDHLLHVSPDRMTRIPYSPMIGHRQAKTEDRTVPRVTVAPTILGCIYGYAIMSRDVFYANSNQDIADKFPPPGYYIHEIPFEYCLRPNKKLVYDADTSDEHWLVRYSSETKEYRATVAGKCFVERVVLYPVHQQPTRHIVTLFVEVLSPKGLLFTQKTRLEKGYHSVEFVYAGWGYKAAKGLTIREVADAKRISAGTYMKNKKYQVATLSHQEPNYYAW